MRSRFIWNEFIFHWLAVSASKMYKIFSTVHPQALDARRPVLFFYQNFNFHIRQLLYLGSPTLLLYTRALTLSTPDPLPTPHVILWHILLFGYFITVIRQNLTNFHTFLESAVDDGFREVSWANLPLLELTLPQATLFLVSSQKQQKQAILGKKMTKIGQHFMKNVQKRSTNDTRKSVLK